MWGWGRTSASRGMFGSNSAGPMWSKKTKGPTIRRAANGSTRPTSKPPRLRRLAWIAISMGGLHLGCGDHSAGRSRPHPGFRRETTALELFFDSTREFSLRLPIGEVLSLVGRRSRARWSRRGASAKSRNRAFHSRARRSQARRHRAFHRRPVRRDPCDGDQLSEPSGRRGGADRARLHPRQDLRLEADDPHPGHGADRAPDGGRRSVPSRDPPGAWRPAEGPRGHLPVRLHLRRPQCVRSFGRRQLRLVAPSRRTPGRARGFRQRLRRARVHPVDLPL